MGLMIKAIQNELTAVDDRTFRWVLKKPYPKMLLALGKTGTPCCFIMPARIAATDPFRQIGEYVGSGPMRFVKNEWVPGAKAVFEKFADYVPRQEPASWLAGGKQILADRIEWVTIPDPATAAAALQNGEVDWWQTPIPDLVPVLKKNRNVMVDISDPLGTIGIFRINHLFPPFNDVRARRAILTALSQEDYMHAVVGDDDSMWKPMPGFFTPGTPLYNEEGGEILKGPRKLDAAKRLLAESGYAGQPVTCLAAQDDSRHKAWGDVTADLLETAWHEGGFCRDRLGHRRRSPGAEIAARPGRLAHVPHHRPRARTTSTRPTSACAQMATAPSSDGRPVRKSRPRSRPGSTQRRSTRRRPSRAGSTRPRSIMWSMRRSASSSVSGLAQERHRHRARAAAVLLGVSKTV